MHFMHQTQHYCIKYASSPVNDNLSLIELWTFQDTSRNFLKKIIPL